MAETKPAETAQALGVRTQRGRCQGSAYYRRIREGDRQMKTTYIIEKRPNQRRREKHASKMVVICCKGPKDSVPAKQDKVTERQATGRLGGSCNGRPSRAGGKTKEMDPSITKDQGAQPGPNHGLPVGKGKPFVTKKGC